MVGGPRPSFSKRWGIRPGSACTVTEIADGTTGTVIATVSGDNQTVTIPAGKAVAVSLMDVYDDGSPAADSGRLTVTKTIAGPAAGRQGAVAILVACGGPVYNFAFLIPAHARPGSVSRHFEDIPSGSRCTVTEAADGHTNTVDVAARGRATTVTIPASGSAAVDLTDRFKQRAKQRPKQRPKPAPPSFTG